MSLPALRPTSTLKRWAKQLPTPRNPFTMLWYMLYRGKIEPKDIPSSIIPFPEREYSFKEISFTFAVIALSARIASLDGDVTKSKYLAFREAFPIEPGVCEKIRALFSMACADQTPFNQYVRHVTIAYPRRMSLYTAMVDRLFKIACADDNLSKPTEQMLAKIAHMLHIGPSDFASMRARNLHAKKAHEVLGVDRKSKSDALRRRYHELLRRYHPDRFAAEALTPEIELMLQLKISEINDAYKQLAQKAA